MVTVSALLTLCAGNPSVIDEFTSQMPVTRSVYVFVISAWTKSWVNNQDAVNLRRHRRHYDAIVMSCSIAALFWTTPCVPHIWLIESYIGFAIGSSAFGNESISLIYHLQHGLWYLGASDLRCSDKFRHRNYDNGYIRLPSYTNASADNSANIVKTSRMDCRWKIIF